MSRDAALRSDEGMREAAELVRGAECLVVTTGAGMSRESGIPTFRDALDGLWANYDPLELATPQGFRRDPARVWGWYNYRRGLIAQAQPHAGHVAVAELERLVPDVAVVTQNIDGLHRRAGSTTVLELHGNIERFRCFDREHAVDIEIPVSENDGPLEPPSCPQCGSPIRPDVVWFGELLPAGVLERAEQLALGCDVMLVVGTSGIVYPAAGLPATARVSGASVIEINTEASELTGAMDIFLEGEAGFVLPQLVERAQSLSQRSDA